MSELPSLRRRVALTIATTAALGGGVAAVAAGWTAGALLRQHEDGVMLAETRALSEEVLEEIEEDALGDDDADSIGPRTLADMLAHELSEVRLHSPNAVVRRGGRVLAGDPALPHPPIGTCQTWDAVGAPTRVCTVAMDDAELTMAASAAHARDQLALVLRALLVGACVGALLGAIASVLVSRWALGPLAALGERVRRVDPSRPRAEVLATREEHRELEALRASIAELVERLAEALGVARGFAAQAAHELRTPLTTIAGELELLAEDEPLDRRSLDRARAQLAQLAGLIDRLLVLARPDELEASEAVDLSDVVADVARSLDDASRARLDVHCESDPIVNGDTAMLGALVSNLVGNALKFSSDRVSVDVGHDGALVVIAVRDRGPGISEDERARVLAPFYRSPSARASSTEGHGVGLALVAHVARAHRGEVVIEEARPGARVRVRLPRWSSPRVSNSAVGASRVGAGRAGANRVSASEG